MKKYILRITMLVLLLSLLWAMFTSPDKDNKTPKKEADITTVKQLQSFVMDSTSVASDIDLIKGIWSDFKGVKKIVEAIDSGKEIDTVYALKLYKKFTKQ